MNIGKRPRLEIYGAFIQLESSNNSPQRTSRKRASTMMSVFNDMNKRQKDGIFMSYICSDMSIFTRRIKCTGRYFLNFFVK